MAGANPRESFRHALEILAEEAYEDVAYKYGNEFSKNPKEIYWQDACLQFSESLKDILQRKNIKSKFRYLDIKSLKPRAPKHVILETADYLIDGTWQQFEDGSPHPDHRCLILRKNALEEDLEKARVPRRLWFLYLGASPK